MLTQCGHTRRQTIMVTGSPWNTEAHEPWLAAMHQLRMARDLRAVGGDAARRHAPVHHPMARPQGQARRLAWRADIMGARIANWIAIHDSSAPAPMTVSAPACSALCRIRHGASPALCRDLSGAPLLIAIKGLLASGGLPRSGGAKILPRPKS